MSEYCVYKHTTPSGKVYIGITSQNIYKRWKNGAGYELCTAFQRAIQKYGWKNIKHEVLATGLTKQQACDMEVSLIAQYQSSDPAYGYNLTCGGEHYEFPEHVREAIRQRVIERYEREPEIKEKISKAQIGRKMSPETRAKHSAAMKAYIAAHPEARERCGALFRGKKRPAETREKMRQASSVKVKCNETGAVFNSVMAAADFACVSRTAVTNNLKGRSRTTGGYTFSYYNVGDTRNE